MVAWMGPLATLNREPGQARKGAATAVDLCAGVWLVQVAAYYFTPLSKFHTILCICCISKHRISVFCVTMALDNLTAKIKEFHELSGTCA